MSVWQIKNDCSRPLNNCHVVQILNVVISLILIHYVNSKRTGIVVRMYSGSRNWCLHEMDQFNSVLPMLGPQIVVF